MSSPFLAQITMFGSSFNPRGWSFCNGQLLDIASNTALFSLLGTTYGGDGRVTFALPDLRGRVPLHSGHSSPGPGLSNRTLGEQGGSEQNTLTVGQLPSHTHTYSPQCNTGEANADNPEDNYPAPGSEDLYADSTDGTMAQGTTGPTGNSQPVNNMQPFLAINFIIALVATFPSRN